MQQTTPVAAPPGQGLPRRFCRACGFDLRASDRRCPDCGGTFNPADARTFAQHPPRAIWRWLRRTAYVGLALLILAGGAVAWLRNGWQDEQQRLADLRSRLGAGKGDVAIVSEPINPWLRDRLPQHVGIYLDRVARLDVYSTAATDDDLKTVGSFRHLRRLMLQSMRLTDAGFAHLRELTQLERLDLSIRQVTDAGIANLAGMRRLQDLTIWGGQVTDAALEHLHGMPQLQRLTVCGNPVTREGLLRWKKRHPGVQVSDGPGGPISAKE